MARNQISSVLSHGWRPETGFISYDYGAYSEAILVYLLGPRRAGQSSAREHLGSDHSARGKPTPEPNRSREAPSSFIKCHPDFSIFATSVTNLALTIGYHRQMR